LWFDNHGEEAARFYTSIFPNSRIGDTTRGEDGKVIAGTFELSGQEFQYINGGPMFTFSEAISLYVHCKDQAEVDYYYGKLLEGGEESQCGWLKDRYGLSWQIVPNRLGELLGAPDREAANRAMQAMLQMRKLDVAKLEAAFAG
jgi:predicted 3-demethylubiquinone-9 3-methyltransferase (glyoxalase superfamily)